MLTKEVAEFGEMDHIEFTGNDEKSLIILNVSLVQCCIFDKHEKSE